ncbi:HK97-gp10 family putative phage morphogenesis protein [Sutcliffiella horikoshii]|uniref:HK97-gp10 family putative phage morphogenesis protein n=1 Tax=Sutcliffiella horikoshii TaxID=79883 RepID=UPI003CFB5A38
MAKKEVEGLSELMKRIQNMGDEGKKMTESILKEAVKPMKREVEQNAPDFEGKHLYEKKYGKLKDNIEIEYEEKSDTVFITSGNSFWSTYLEYGTKSMKKQPFMEKSYLNKKDEVRENIIRLAKERLGLK